MLLIRILYGQSCRLRFTGGYVLVASGFAERPDFLAPLTMPATVPETHEASLSTRLTQLKQQQMLKTRFSLTKLQQEFNRSTPTVFALVAQ
jgi:hypothetical protein